MKDENKSSEASEVAVIDKLIKRPPDYDEVYINKVTQTSVPEGIWINVDINKEYICRRFGKKYKKCNTSIEVKRIYRTDEIHIHDMATRALNSLPLEVQDTFKVKRHIVAFVLKNDILSSFEDIKRRIIKHIRKGLEKKTCLVPCLDVYFFTGGKIMF